MRPTHRHADGGVYQLIEPCSIKHPSTGEWVDGVAYRGEDGKLRSTTKERWDERFEELSIQQVAEDSIILENDEGEIVAEFIFKIEEAGDIRYMLITAGPQPSSNIRSEEREWLKRVLKAQAEMVTEGLHVREHDFPDLIGDVAAFHAKFGQEYKGKPRMLPPDLHDFRVKFHREETEEYADEYTELGKAIANEDRRDIISALEKQLDGLADSVWVLLGTADLQFGKAVFYEAWRRVVKANMAKVRKDAAEDGHTDSGRAPKYDIVKPAGWLAPDHRDLVSDNAIFDELFAPPPEDIETNTYNDGGYSDTRRV